MSSGVRRRVGFIVENGQGTLDISVHSLDFEEIHYEELKEYSNVIFEVKPIVVSFEVVKKNFEEIFTTASSYKEDIKDTKSAGPTEIHLSLESMVSMTQRIGNFLAAASSFLTNSEVRLEKVYGKDSKELESWNEFRRNLHKNKFSYRFMYELRNYSQHYGLPLSGFNLNLNDMLTTDKKVNFVMYLSKDELLKDKFNWKKLSCEIGLLEETTDIVPFLTEYFDVIKAIFIKFMDQFCPKLIECHEYVATFHKVFKIPEGVSPMLFKGESPNGQPPKDAEFVPTDQFNWVRSKYISSKMA